MTDAFLRLHSKDNALVALKPVPAGPAISIDGQPAVLADNIAAAAEPATDYDSLGYGSFAAGNATGELSTIEEKSPGAYVKSGDSSISSLIKPSGVPPRGGLYLMDVVPDGEVRIGFPNISDNADAIIEGQASLEQIGREIYDTVVGVAAGQSPSRTPWGTGSSS